MTIVIDARLYGLKHRGLGRYLMELINGLVNYGSGHTYILLMAPEARTALPSLPVNFRTVQAPYKVYSLAEQINLPRLIKKLKPDLVHWPHFSAPLLYRGKFILTIHDLILHHFPSSRATSLPKLVYWLKILAYKFLLKSLTARANKIITVSQAVAADVIKHYPQAAAKVITIPLAAPNLPAGQPYQSRQPYLLLVGATYPHKNIARAIEAVALLRQERPELELWLVGRIDFFAQRLKQQVTNQNQAGWVKFLGQVDDLELASLYRGCLVYLLPSLAEGFGLGAWEALAAGAVVVAADIPVLRETLGEAAILANPKSALALAQAIKKALLPQVREELKLAAQARLAKYSWTKTAQKTLSVYESIN